MDACLPGGRWGDRWIERDTARRDLGANTPVGPNDIWVTTEGHLATHCSTPNGDLTWEAAPRVFGGQPPLAA